MPAIAANPIENLPKPGQRSPGAFDHMDNSAAGMRFSEKVLTKEGKIPERTNEYYDGLQENKKRLDAAKNDMASLSAMDWLQITLKQLQCQVPGEDTMKASEIASQFTSMGMLTGMNRVADNITDMKKGIDSLVELKASSSVGRMIEAESGSFRIKNKQIPPLGFELSEEVDKVEFAIYDDAGKLIHSRTLDKDLTAGKHFVEWQGETNDELPIKDGYYRFSARAVDANGKVLRSNQDGSIIQAKTFMLGRLEDVNKLNKEIVVDGVALPRDAWRATLDDRGHRQEVSKGETQASKKTNNPMEGFTDELKREIDELNAAKAAREADEKERQEILDSIL